jgi:opacity protein-like surface antigen
VKKLSVIVLVVLSVAFAGMADAATPKKRTRNAKRIGPYGALFVGQTRYTGDQSEFEQDLLDIFGGQEDPNEDLSVSTKKEDLGYQAAFGYRFNRYFAAELALAQYGELASVAKGDIDQGTGVIPASIKYAFTAGGPVFSAIGILPLGEKAEIYGRAGYLFASSERELSARVGGENGGGQSAKGDSQNLVLGLGFAWHFGQIYSVRAEYQKIDDVGQKNRTGKTEDLNVIGLGLVVRF